MPEVLRTAELLKAKGVSAEVVSFHTVKPLDTAYLEQAAQRFKLLVTVEEHGLIGGLGGAIAEWRAYQNRAIPQLSFGTPDHFMHEIGSQKYAQVKYGLEAEQMAARVLERLASFSEALAQRSVA
jgi:transketolase